MIVGQLLSPVHSLGPGNRVCLWVQGCSKDCPGCISPEFQKFQGNQVSEDALARLLVHTARKGNCTGLTISGGDPFEQATALLRLLQLVKDEFEDILVYTGFELQEITRGCSGKAGIACLKLIDVLIDGVYIKELNRPDCVLRGSSNQSIYYLNPDLESVYTEYMKLGRILETFSHGDQVIITGIMNEVTQ